MSGDITAGDGVLVYYDGTQFQMLTPARTPVITAGAIATAALADNAVDETKLKDALVGDFTEVTVAAGDSILLGDADDSGNTKRDTVQGILDLVTSISEADQTAIENETVEATYVPPDLLRHHPGIAKAWVKFQTDGTMDANYNILSITDNGTGDFTVNFTTAFSSANYACVGSVLISGTAERVVTFDAQVAGSCDLVVTDLNGAVTDAGVTAIMCSFFGDQ